MISPTLVMLGVAALSLIGGIVILARPARSEQAVYVKRIAGTMAVAFAVILTLFAWGLEQIGS